MPLADSSPSKRTLFDVEIATHHDRTRPGATTHASPELVPIWSERGPTNRPGIQSSSDDSGAVGEQADRALPENRVTPSGAATLLRGARPDLSRRLTMALGVGGASAAAGLGDDVPAASPRLLEAAR